MLLAHTTLAQGVGPARAVGDERPSQRQRRRKRAWCEMESASRGAEGGVSSTGTAAEAAGAANLLTMP